MTCLLLTGTVVIKADTTTFGKNPWRTRNYSDEITDNILFVNAHEFDLTGQTLSQTLL
ncbi:hypothetical protein [Carboxydothermus hydrogenoformans]|uniref:hypothetical protein n=1 Tax=Carboxydothermus hydrogenoformans TaxID=129958 RepID=UPI00139232CC|nr:hypothetical protein [Carboxydothermus hydrogenoformans]